MQAVASFQETLESKGSLEKNITLENLRDAVKWRATYVARECARRLRAAWLDPWEAARAAELLTPSDLQQRHGMPGGQWHHLEPSLDQMLLQTLQSLRTPWADHLMVRLTSLGDAATVAAVSAMLVRPVRSRMRWSPLEQTVR